MNTEEASFHQTLNEEHIEKVLIAHRTAYNNDKTHTS